MNSFLAKICGGVLTAVAAAGFFFSGGASEAKAEGCALQAAEKQAVVDGFPLKLQLIWGTDTDIQTIERLKGKFQEVDPSVKERLGEFLKWKYYYEISNKKANLKDDKEQAVKMSRYCELKIRKIEDQVVEVELYGKDKLVVKKKAKITAKKPQSIAGKNEENSDFWCVLISVDDDPTGEKAAAKEKALKAKAEKAEKAAQKTEEKK